MGAGPDSNDAGLTLVELLVAMAITAIITATVGSAMVVGLRTADATGERLDESHDAQLLSTYLIADLQSVAEAGTTTSFMTTAAVCPASEAGYTSASNVLRLTWTQSRPTSITYTAEYRRAFETATQQWVLLRKTCSSAGASTMLVVVHQLHATTLPVADATQPPNVTLTITEPSGYRYSVSGVRRTPDAAPLPATPWACTVLSAIGNPDPATRATSAPGPLVADQEIVVQTGGACSALRVTVKPNPSSSVTLDLTESPSGSGRYVRTLSKSAYVWTDGEKLFPITSGAATLATLRLTVKQACLASSLVAAPTTVRRTDGAAPTTLASTIDIAATTTGVCLPLEVAFEPRPGFTSTVALAESSPGNWTGSIVAPGETWTDGPHALRLVESGLPATLASTGISITPSCVVTPGSATATPSTVGRTGPGKTDLESDVQVAVTTTGSCSGLKVVFSPGDPSDGAVTVALTEASPGNWTGTVSRTAGKWTSGTKVLAIRDLFEHALSSIDLVVTN